MVTGTPVLQAGQITPTHAAVWATDGVVQDGGPIGASQRVLASNRGASFNTPLDQPIILPNAITAFLMTGIIVTNASVSLTTAAGGFYTGTFKTGTALVAATQAYSDLTTPNALLFPVLATNVPLTRFSGANLSISAFPPFGFTIYFSLTTTQGVPCSADIYLVGVDLT